MGEKGGQVDRVGSHGWCKGGKPSSHIGYVEQAMGMTPPVVWAFHIVRPARHEE